MLGIPEDAIHVTMGDVGGSFGQKMFTDKEEHAVVIAARLIGGRPIKWIEDRAENLISGGHSRQESITVTVAVDDEGRLLAGKAHHVEDVGAYPRPGNGHERERGHGHVPRGRTAGVVPARSGTARRASSPTPAATAPTGGPG